MTGAGPDLTRVHRECQLQRFADLIDLGRQELGRSRFDLPQAADAVVGSIYAHVVRKLQGGRRRAPAPKSFVPD